MENSPRCNSIAGHQIATNFCTCHDSTAVVPCTKWCSDHCIRIEVRVKQNFHRIWIAMEKPLEKPGTDRHIQSKKWNVYNISHRFLSKINLTQRSPVAKVSTMTSSNGNIFRVTGLLCGEFTGHQWIPRTKASDAELWYFLWSVPEPTLEQTMETLVIWDATVLLMTSLKCCHNVMCRYVQKF